MSLVSKNKKKNQKTPPKKTPQKNPKKRGKKTTKKRRKAVGTLSCNRTCSAPSVPVAQGWAGLIQTVGNITAALQIFQGKRLWF